MTQSHAHIPTFKHSGGIYTHTHTIVSYLLYCIYYHFQQYLILENPSNGKSVCMCVCVCANKRWKSGVVCFALFYFLLYDYHIDLFIGHYPQVKRLLLLMYRTQEHIWQAKIIHFTWFFTLAFPYQGLDLVTTFINRERKHSQLTTSFAVFLSMAMSLAAMHSYTPALFLLMEVISKYSSSE